MEQELLARGFVDITDLIPDAIIDLRYFSDNNFVGERIKGYEANVALLTKEAAEALKLASDRLRSQGYLIKIYDTYRPSSAVRHFVCWAKDLSDTRMKERFYPYIDKSELFARGFIAEKSGHSRGSTVDLTLVEISTGKELDMGCIFDYFGKRSCPSYTKNLTPEQINNREILRAAMSEFGFRPDNEEWWHFSLKNEPYPDTYFDFPITEQKD